MSNFLRILVGIITAACASLASAAVLVDHSNITTGVGNGFNGANTSAIATNSTTFGFNSNSSGTNGTNFQLADDFTIAQQATVNAVTVYAYSTSSYPNPPTSPFTGVTVSIWSAQPGSSGASILSTSTTFTTSWTGVYRVQTSTLTNAQRPVMALKASFPSVSLPAGTYWVSWGITAVTSPGSAGSVFTPPLMNTDGGMPQGNAIQTTDGGATWIATADATSAATNDFPLLVEGAIVKTPTTTTLVGSPNPTTVGNAVTLTATVSGTSPSGTVQFFADGTAINGCEAVALSGGSAACVVSAASLHVGSNAFTATYAGDVANLGSLGNFTETVNKVSAGVALGSACQSTFTAGEPYTLAAAVTGQSPTGTVSFLVNSGPVAGCSNVAVSGGAASCTTSDLPQGPLSLTANYSGDANNASANSAALMVTVLDAADVIFRDNLETISPNCPVE